MARTADSFLRQKARYKPLPTKLVICEDSKSGVQYLKNAARYFRAEVKVEVSHCGHTDPKGIVKEALSRQGKFDHVYCVIDRDMHPSFDEAITLSNASPKITVIDSHPCFEFWLLLHYKRSRRPYYPSGKNSAGDNVVKDLRKQPGMEDYEKGMHRDIFAVLLGHKFDHARRVSPLVLNDAITEGNLNPSSKIHLLIDVFDEMSEPELIE